MEINSPSRYMTVHDGIWQQMDQHLVVHTDMYWYVLVHPEYRHHGCPASAGFAPAILGRSAPGTEYWIGCLCRHIHKCMHKLIYSWSWRKSLLWPSLLQLQQLSGKLFAAVAEAETVAEPEKQYFKLHNASGVFCLQNKTEQWNFWISKPSKSTSWKLIITG